MKAATANSIGRALILLGLLNLILLFASQVFSAEVQIIEIRKSLALKNGDPITTDYYLNAGENLGIKPGTLFTLYRRVSVVDRLGSNQGKPLAVPVGKVKIIYVSRDLSVARVHEIQKFDKTPVLEFQGVMLGDVINVGSAEAAKDTGTQTSENSGSDESERKPAENIEVIELKAKVTNAAVQEAPNSLYPLTEGKETVLQ